MVRRRDFCVYASGFTRAGAVNDFHDILSAKGTESNAIYALSEMGFDPPLSGQTAFPAFIAERTLASPITDPKDINHYDNI